MNKFKGSHADTADRIEFRFLVVVAFTICVFAVGISRIFGAGGPATESIFAEAKSAAFAAVGYAFHL
ncbi:MAG: hypothetical protein U5K75_05355 [Ahrensia sp.]|nr:hypothetical protein [Ahrensia sp.]